MNRYLIALLIASAASPVCGGAAHSQPNQTIPVERSRIPALLVIVDTLSTINPRYRILRTSGDPVSDAILLPRNADPEMVTEAILALQMIRQRAPGVGTAPAELRMRTVSEAHPMRRVLPWAGRIIGDLRRAPYGDMAPLGRVRSIQIWLPSPRHD
ncbi:MAG TPA: hypothetical protein VEY93_14175 [Longimicrobium sp.]|nr:hypothetical protein [Longimicrobium sp.]